MSSDESSRNQDFPEITFPEVTSFETQRTLVCLLKWEPSETKEEFAERVMKAWKEYQAKEATKLEAFDSQ